MRTRSKRPAIVARAAVYVVTGAGSRVSRRRHPEGKRPPLVIGLCVADEADRETPAARVRLRSQPQIGSDYRDRGYLQNRETLDHRITVKRQLDRLGIVAQHRIGVERDGRRRDRLRPAGRRSPL